MTKAKVAPSITDANPTVCFAAGCRLPRSTEIRLRGQIERGEVTDGKLRLPGGRKVQIETKGAKVQVSNA